MVQRPCYSAKSLHDAVHHVSHLARFPAITPEIRLQDGQPQGDSRSQRLVIGVQGRQACANSFQREQQGVLEGGRGAVENTLGGEILLHSVNSLLSESFERDPT